MYIISLFIVFHYINYQSKTRIYDNIKNVSVNYTDNFEFLKGFDLRYGLEKDNDTLLTEIKNNFMKKKTIRKIKKNNYFFV